MAGLTTIALLERRRSISRDLFTRYWRDVHGVMAARIPGFARYVQYHVTRVGGDERAPAIEGIAIVGFASEQDREGLAASAISPEIVRDEPNLFERALLSNLGFDDVVQYGGEPAEGDAPGRFALFEDHAAAHAFAGDRGTGSQVYDLAGGDPETWNGAAADALTWRYLVHYAAGDENRAVEPGLSMALYRTDHRFVLVDNGRPTALGLRGADALRTIEEAGAANQLEPRVEALIYAL